MDPYDILNKLDALIQSRSILRHPFYVAWQEGTLTKTQLATYARMYWPHVAAFPSYLEASMEKTADPVIRETLARNLHDERTNPKPHPELWLDFATSPGQSRQEVTAAAPHRSARHIVNTFRRLATSSTLEDAPGTSSKALADRLPPPVNARTKGRPAMWIDSMNSGGHDSFMSYPTVHGRMDFDVHPGWSPLGQASL